MRTTTTSVLSALTIIVIGCGGGSPSTTVDEVASLAGSPSSVGDEAGAGGEIIPAAAGGAAGSPSTVPSEGGAEGGDAGAAGAPPATGGAATGGAVEPPPTGGALGGLGSGGTGAEPPQTGGQAASGGSLAGGTESGGATTGGAEAGTGGADPQTGGQPGLGGAAGELTAGGSAGAVGGVPGGAGAGGAAGPDCLWQEAVRVFPPYRFTWQDWEYVNEVEGTCSRCEGPICSELELSFGSVVNPAHQPFNVNVVQNRHFYMVSGCGEETYTCEVGYGTTRLSLTLVWSGTAWMVEVDREHLGEVSVYCSWIDDGGSVFDDIPGYRDMQTDFGLELADWIETIEWRCP